MRTTPKLVGGLTEACAERARQLYELVCGEVVVPSTPEAAELAKLLENIFRSVNIALVNELAQLCDRLGIDVWEVIEAAATKPFGFMRFDPGPGMGGHCLPVDPFYLAFKAREHDFYPEFIELAVKSTAPSLPHRVDRIARALPRPRRRSRAPGCCCSGSATRRGVGDIRESAALEIVAMPARAGERTSDHDPFGAGAARVRPRLDRSRRGAALGHAAVTVTAHPASTTARSSRRFPWWSTSAGHAGGSTRRT